jgi:hypothetical protein
MTTVVVPVGVDGGAGIGALAGAGARKTGAGVVDAEGLATAVGGTRLAIVCAVARG